MSCVNEKSYCAKCIQRQLLEININVLKKLWFFYLLKQEYILKQIYQIINKKPTY